MILKEILSSLYYPVRIPEMLDFLSNFLVTHFHFFLVHIINLREECLQVTLLWLPVNCMDRK